MANKASRYGRTLIIFVLAVVAMYGGLALNGDWKPKLGLDLQGGTRITLEASTETGEAITPEKLEEAAGIIDSRVNAYGVAESEVATQGDRNIVVEIPGENRDDIVDSVKQTAQLRFRLVAGSAPGQPAAEPTPSPSPSPSPAEKAGKGKKQKTEPSASPAGRAVSQGLVRADETPKPKKEQQPSDEPSPEVPAQPTGEVPTDDSSIEELLAWARNPDPASMRKFAEFTCEDAGDVADNPAKPLLACDEDGNKYLLSPAIIEGTQLSDASFGIPQNDVQYVVNLDFNGDAADVFAEVTRAISGTQEQFAIVLD